MRRNHAKRTNKERPYQVDYIILADHPEISHIIVEPMRTIYRNIAACEYAPMVPVIKHSGDPAMRLLTGKI